jgi:hypothetical protein
MNKKFLGIKISTILTAIGCIAVAFIIREVAKYNIDFPTDTDVNAGIAFSIISGLL